MNVDDPRLTAYALGELPEHERIEIEKLLEQSPAARQFVNETQEFAAVLRRELRDETPVAIPRSAAVMDLHDDPLFWSRARPLAIAALIAVLAICSAILLGPRKSEPISAARTNQSTDFTEIDGVDRSVEVGGPDTINNPFTGEAIGRVERVVIGQLPPDVSGTKEIRVIETITDSGRVSRLKNRLATENLARKQAGNDTDSKRYELIFLDHGGQIVAAASFHYVTGIGFVLQPSRHGRAAGGRYFMDGDTPPLPGDWKPGINYSDYLIAFPDWHECIGYSPGV